MIEKNELPAHLLAHTPWENEASPIWPASSLILHRNLSKYLFPVKQSEMQAAQVLTILKKAFSEISTLNNLTFLPGEKASLLDKEFVYEHFLDAEPFQHTMPLGAFIFDDTAEFLALLNVEDHLQLHCLDTKGEWEKAWNRLSSLDTDLSNSLNFAFSPRFGYLTEDPTICGSALIVHAYLHLPALIHLGRLEETLIKQKEQEIEAISLQGSLQEIVGDMVILKNSYTLGLTEANIFAAIHLSATRLISEEKALRIELQRQTNPEIKDQVSRAYGLLLHSYQLKTKEALDALSLIKLGIDLGWIQGVTDKKINEVFFKCRHAHLARIFNEKTLDPAEAAIKRAAFIHKELQGMILT